MDGETEMSLIFLHDQSSELNSDGLGEYAEVESTKLYPGQVLNGTGFRLIGLEDPKISTWARDTVYADILQEGFAQATAIPSFDLTPRDVTRWKMAWREIQSRPESNYSYRSMFSERCKDWPETEDMLKLPIALAFSATALAYGGLHALAWHAHFKSPTEQLLWRISACIVMGGMPLLLLFTKLDNTLRKSSWQKYSWQKSSWSLTRVIKYYLYEYLYSLIMLLLASAYGLARAYLVVECFINLAHLPAEVYDVPSWASYFPHIS